MNAEIKIQLLGIGAAKIHYNGINIFIDAFNSYNKTPEIQNEDIILFTHDDSDHFLPQPLLDKLTPQNIIIGPPSIVLPLLEKNITIKNQLRIFYPQDYNDPNLFTHDNVQIETYNTDHFLDWHSIHVSFLIKLGGKTIYFCGDSRIRSENETKLKNIDCIIYSLLKYEIVKEEMNKKYGKYFHFCELLEIKQKFKPKLIIGNHMINCAWAIDPAELQRLLNAENVCGVTIPTGIEDTIII